MILPAPAAMLLTFAKTELIHSEAWTQPAVLGRVDEAARVELSDCHPVLGARDSGVITNAELP
jgi:hypothetical protein